MKQGLIVVGKNTSEIPSLIAQAGVNAEKSFLEFFVADIRNPRTREAYMRAVNRFCVWCEENNLTLKDIEPFHVGAYVEAFSKTSSAPTVNQHLSAVRRLLDFVVVQRIVTVNPSKSVRGINHEVMEGKTPIPSSEETKILLSSISLNSVIGLRDRALIGLLLYSFARVTAAISLSVEDYYPQGKRWFLQLHEKGGKVRKMPVHHCLEEYLDEYTKAAGLKEYPKTPLFRSSYKRSGLLTENAMQREDVYRMIQRRKKDAEIETKICCHSFRARGITSYLENGGIIENAQKMAAHASPSTTKLYDRRGEAVSLDEVERIIL